MKNERLIRPYYATNREFPDATINDAREARKRRAGRWLELSGLVLLGYTLGWFAGWNSCEALRPVRMALTTSVFGGPCPPGQVCPVDPPQSKALPNLTPADGVPLPWETAVRIRVFDPESNSGWTGSGTVIDGNADRALILTCAHLFAEAKGGYKPPKSFRRKLSVELFGPKLVAGHVEYVETHDATVVDFDGVKDVALCAIAPGRILRASPIAFKSYRGAVGEAVVSLGCSAGKNPTIWKHALRGQIRAADGYSAWAVVPQPVQGRSGGGLFSLDCRVIGVCSSAGVDTPDGYYPSPASIRAILAKNGRDDLADPAVKAELVPELENIAPDHRDRHPARPIEPISTPPPTVSGESPPVQPFFDAVGAPFGLNRHHFHAGFVMGAVGWFAGRFKGSRLGRLLDSLRADNPGPIAGIRPKPTAPPLPGQSKPAGATPLDSALDALTVAINDARAERLRVEQAEASAKARAELLDKLGATVLPTSMAPAVSAAP